MGPAPHPGPAQSPRRPSPEALSPPDAPPTGLPPPLHWSAPGPRPHPVSPGPPPAVQAPPPRTPYWPARAGPAEAPRPRLGDGRAADAPRGGRAGGDRGAGQCAAACGWAWCGCCWHGRPAPRGPRAVRGDHAATRTWRATCAGGASSPPRTSSCAWTPAAACRAPAGVTAPTVSSGRGAGQTGRREGQGQQRW